MKKKLLLFTLFILITVLGHAKVIYVDSSAVDGADTGETWSDAFTDLQVAIDSAEENDEIWVAAATYKPNTTFSIDVNLRLYGGFIAGGEDWDSRNPELNLTILSGDLLGNDVDDDFVSFKSDNVEHVISVNSNIDASSVIDGFIVEGGHANGLTLPKKFGGGIKCFGTPIIQNCIFRQNYALRDGGAIHYSVDSDTGASVEIKGCEFIGNSAYQFGGALDLILVSGTDGAVVSIDSCVFHKNITETHSGAAILARLQSTNMTFVLSNSTFTENENVLFGTATIAGGQGGGGTATIKNCSFRKNYSNENAALDFGSDTDAGYFNYEIFDCEFIENEATDFGGALDVWMESPGKFNIDNCLFWGNYAGNQAGAIATYMNSPDVSAVVSNCILENNQSPSGAAVATFPFQFSEENNDSITFVNCLFTGNGKEDDEGTIVTNDAGHVLLQNCTLAGNFAGGIRLNGEAKMSLQNTILYNSENNTESAVLSGNSTFTSFGGNLIRDTSLAGLNMTDQHEKNPAFVGSGESCDAFQLSSISPAINKGVAQELSSEHDLCGNERVQDDGIDIGAIESPHPTSLREVLAGKLILSPNPSTDFLNIQFPNYFKDSSVVSLFNIEGQLVKEYKLTANQKINIQDLRPGLYTLKTVNSFIAYTGKFIKH